MKHGFKMDVDVAKELLNEVLSVCYVKTSNYRSALLAIEMSILHSAINADANDLLAEKGLLHPSFH
jgi:hypothetical protein